MKPSEILRNLADMIDARQQNKMSAQEPETIQSDEPEDTNGLAQAPDVFLPPLQLKIELLKKATGVDNVYDEESAEEEQSNGYDELEHIKRNAGINVVALDALGDDEPLEG
jgi:hypothetical protein